MESNVVFKNIILFAWALLAAAFVVGGAYIAFSDEANLKLNEENVDHMLGGVCLLIAGWILSVAMAYRFRRFTYALVSSVLFGAIWACLLAVQLWLIYLGNPAVYSVLTVCVLVFVLALATAWDSSTDSKNGNVSMSGSKK
jgi:hypothetical protein